MNQFLRLHTIFQVLLLVSSINANAQVYNLELNQNPLGVKYPVSIEYSLLEPAIQRITNFYRLSGYLEYSVDSISRDTGTIKVWVHTGQPYRITSVRIISDSPYFRYKGLEERFRKQKYDSGVVSDAVEGILGQLENNGYPFAIVNLEVLTFEDGVELICRIDKGVSFVFDTCHIDGDPVLRKSFLESYTGIKAGTLYNEALFRKAHDKLNQLPFLISERVPQIVFLYSGKARPYYYLKKRRSDQVNGIIGLAPSPGTAGSNTGGSVNLTGEFTLKLNNLFKSAKVLHLNWRSFRARSQELKTYFSYPYLFSRPVGIDGGLELLKFDTLYTVLQRQIGVQYYTSGISGMKAFYSVSTTNLNALDTAFLRTTKSFPSINSVETKQYGIMFSFSKLDYRFNPRKGYFADGSVSVGSKEILRDNRIEEIRFGPENYNLYDSSVLKSTQYQYALRAEQFIPLGSRSACRIGVQINRIIAPQIYFNELFREGGINSLKGFNEQSIFASHFNMLELEYRLLLGVNSHFRVFWNGAYYEDRNVGRTEPLKDTPWGFGAGGNIETGAGILTVIYALGKERSNPFDLRTGKFHFGISSYF